MKFRFAAAAVATFAFGLVCAQTPAPQPTPAVAAAPAALPVPPAPAPAVSKSWILMDYATGQVLAGENIHQQLAPASITKVMTSYVVAAEIKNGKVKRDDQVMMSERAWREGGAGTDGSYSGFRSTRRRVWKTWKRAWRSSPATMPPSPWPSMWPAAKKPSPR